MNPPARDLSDVLHRVWIGKPTVKKSLTHAIKQTANYRLYVMRKEEAWQKSVDEFEKTVLMADKTRCTTFEEE
jgi:hypothetical protein